MSEDLSTLTIPDLRLLLAAAREELLRVLSARARGESPRPGVYTMVGEVQQLRQALDDAIWRQAVESHRSVKVWAGDRRWGDEGWWHIWRGVLALRWSLNQRRGPLPGFLPSKEVAVVT